MYLTIKLKKCKLKENDFKGFQINETLIFIICYKVIYVDRLNSRNSNIIQYQITRTITSIKAQLF